ncbi:uncharacterized protein [Diadema antillarum]|uniref:uncharacterized protein n=1 Tax=Diadema antillarum TaxID=105358 RepID=UPI003A8C4526
MDQSEIDKVMAEVIMEEAEDLSLVPSDSEVDGVSVSASQVGPSDVMPHRTNSRAQRPSSALTVENLRIHEKSVAQEETSLTRLGSGHSSQRPQSRGSLGPVRTPGSGTPVRLCSGKSGLGNMTDGTSPSPDAIRAGSGKRDPLPPIGTEMNPSQQADLVRLSVSREDGETVLSTARMSARSERSVSFQENAEGGQQQSLKREKKSYPSPAVREVHRTKQSNGMERVTISCPTETEWSWLEMVKFLGKTEEELTAISGKLRPQTPADRPIKSALSTGSKASCPEDVPLLQAREGSRDQGGADRENGNRSEEEEMNEEDNVPPLELDSDSDFSDDEGVKKSSSDQGIPKIGPPRIIKYQRESEQVPISKKYKDAADVIGQKLDIDFNDFNSDVLSEVEDKELEARIKGRSKMQAEDEYDYDYDYEPQEIPVAKASRSNQSLAVSEANGGALTPGLSTVGEVSEVCEFCGKEPKPFPTLEMQKLKDPSELYCCKGYQELVEYTMENTPLSQHPSDEMIDIAPHAPYGSKQARRAAKERAAERMREREMARQRAAGANQANFYALQAHRIEFMDGVARQMKTINYSLASQKCLDEGWTVRPPSPEEEDGNNKLVFVPEPTTPQLPIVFKSKKRQGKETPIVMKRYRSGQLFLIQFEDGTGAVYYPSGALAILITAVEKNQFAYYVQSDGKPEEVKLLAVFEPNGNGTCYHSNGNIRLNLNQFGGTFADQSGTLKKRWSWKDEENLSKTPPFQPICFSINPQLSVRCMTQDQIFVSFNCDLQTCRFNVGSKLKLVAPDHVPPKEIDRDMLYISEIKTYVQMVLDHIFNKKNFSKSPKLDNLRPSLPLQNRVRRNERLKQKIVERKAAKKTGAVVTVN